MRDIFVFGSNTRGIHGAGSALEAVRNHGAVYGQGIGLQGNSYAIPTKDRYLNPLDLGIIYRHIQVFIEFARDNPDMRFNVVKIGCMLAGFKEETISGMFKFNKPLPENIVLPEGW